MIKAAIDRLLPELAQQTLETMFFAMPDEVSLDPKRPPGDLIAASLAFQGLPHGRFGLLASNLLARTLAANFMASDETAELRPDQITGVIGEMANMICGAVLTQLESNASFDLESPEAVQVGEADPIPDFSAGSPSVCRLEFPEGTLVLFLAFEGKK